ncbi:MAG TPA: DHA2 family efflux MFS transporter permease subunit [Candidatus Limnocylindrales bacterium]|nr:DHA2 family efflux MFS transporter permease subunit [Candidatus Limnocylindrales bacterium]
MKANRWLIMLGVAIPAMMVEMSGTSVFVALETITSDLSVSIYRSVWLSTMYLAANAIMIPLAGWMGRKLGYKRVMLLGIAVFTISAFLSGSARNFESLIIFRALQGLGDGPVIPISMALLLEAFPAKERGKMMAGLMLAIGVSPALGPFIASWIVEQLGWRWIFYMTVPLGLLSLATTMLLIPASKPSTQGTKMDWAGFALLALGTGGLQLFLDRGQHYNWFASRFIVVVFIVAVVAFFLFLMRTFIKKDRTVLDLRLLKDSAFFTGNIAYVLLIGGLYGALAIKMIYLQALMNFTPRYAGFYQAVFGVAMVIASMIAGALMDKANPRWPFLIGIPISFYGLYLASQLTLYAGMTNILNIGIIIGVGVGFLSVPVSVCIFTTIKDKDMANASVLNSYLLVMGSSASVAMVIALLMKRMDVNAAYFANVVRCGNPAVQDALFNVGTELAMPVLYEQVMGQAAMFSFNEVLYAMSLVMLLLVIYVPFMKKAKADGKIIG